MKRISLLLACLFAANAFAQVLKKPVQQKTSVAPITKHVQYALVKGHIDNNTNNTFDIGWYTYFNWYMVSVPVSKGGDFTARILIDGSFKQVFVGTDNPVGLSLEPRDTINVSWDAKQDTSTFTIKASNPIRTPMLEKEFLQQKLYTNKNYKLRLAINDRKMPDSVKFQKINDLYNREIETLLTGNIYASTERMAIDIYFDYTHLLANNELLRKYSLYLKKPLEKSNLISILDQSEHFKPYQTESEEYFKKSAKYRDFIFDYVRFNKCFPQSSTLDDESGKNYEQKTLPFAPAIKDYYSGLSSFNIIEIRDWFVTKSIFEDFSYYSFDDATAVYKDFITKVKTPYYTDTLKTFYANIQKLKPGSPAPLFTLINEAGKTVSLNDFKGKVIYIDFWGVGCPPCIYDIKTHAPALHEKYKDRNVVFINICVDANQNEWKENLKKLNLKGVNLVAEGWTKNPVCKAYNVDAIPHYYLLNNEGKIADNNSKNPGMGIDADIDKLLK